MTEFIVCYLFTIAQEVKYYCFVILYHLLTFFFWLVIVACSVALYAGATIVLGRKFSASRFWNDCVDYKVDVFTVSNISYL